MKLLCFGKFLNALCLICTKKETNEISAPNSEKSAAKRNDSYQNQENSIEASNRTCNSNKNLEPPQEMLGDIEQTFTFGQKTFSEACKAYEGNSDSLNPAKKKSKPKQKKKKTTKNRIDKI